MDEAEFRIKNLEAQLEHLRNAEIGELREELHTQYLNKYQLMSEYLSRRENEQIIANSERKRREWPVIVAGVVVGATSVGSLIFQALGH